MNLGRFGNVVVSVVDVERGAVHEFELDCSDGGQMGARFAKLCNLFFLSVGCDGGSSVEGLLMLELESETRMNFLGDFPKRFQVVVHHECCRQLRKFAVSPGVLDGTATMSADAGVTSSISSDKSFTTFLEYFLLLLESENTYLRKSGTGGGGGGGRDIFGLGEETADVHCF